MYPLILKVREIFFRWQEMPHYTVCLSKTKKNITHFQNQRQIGYFYVLIYRQYRYIEIDVYIYDLYNIDDVYMYIYILREREKEGERERENSAAIIFPNRRGQSKKSANYR